MKVHKSSGENMWPCFSSFPLERVDVNVENILGKIYFRMMNLK